VGRWRQHRAQSERKGKRFSISHLTFFIGHFPLDIVLEMEMKNDKSDEVATDNCLLPLTTDKNQ
jgi:hypothetical protein